MRKAGKLIVLGVAAAAIASAPAAAKPDGPKGHGHGPKKAVSYVFKGSYLGPGTVEVGAGNAHVRRAGLVGGAVDFDFSAARISVADTNADGTADLADVLAGDRVVVKVRAPRTDPGPQPFAARQLVDQTHSAD